VVDTYSVGDELEGEVTKVVAFGAFVEILQGVEGLVHISELAAHHVENPREVVAPGQHVIVKIIDIDADRRRLSLSMKRVSEHEPLLPPIALVPGDKPFLADEIAAEESGVPLPSMQVSDAAYSDEVTPEEEAALAFYASSAAADVSGDPVVEPRDADAADDGDDHHVEADPVDEPQASAEVAEAEAEETEAAAPEASADVEEAAEPAADEADTESGDESGADA
jgi:small subunit ribosomal protein S1